MAICTRPYYVGGHWSVYSDSSPSINGDKPSIAAIWTINMTNLKLPCDGGCRCGQVRIRVAAPPLLTMACHCTGCQRMTGSAYALSVAIPSEGFSVTRGNPVIGGMHGATRHYFCPHCMSWMFTRPEGLDFFVNVRPTMLDDPNWFVPFIETMTNERLPWATTPAKYSYERWPEMADFDELIEEFRAQA